VADIIIVACNLQFQTNSHRSYKNCTVTFLILIRDSLVLHQRQQLTAQSRQLISIFQSKTIFFHEFPICVIVGGAAAVAPSHTP
jgi:hypothetical protein